MDDLIENVNGIHIIRQLSGNSPFAANISAKQNPGILSMRIFFKKNPINASGGGVEIVNPSGVGAVGSITRSERQSDLRILHLHEENILINFDSVYRLSSFFSLFLDISSP